MNTDAVVRQHVPRLGMMALAMQIAVGCATTPSGADADASSHRGVSGASSDCAGEARTALHRHVETTGPTPRWEVVQEERDEDGLLLRLSFATQEWQGTSWEHTLLLFLPSAHAGAGSVLLVLRQGTPSATDPEALRTISRATGTAAAILFDLPNQPLFDGLEEDPLLAYSYSQYLRTGDESWPLLLPVVGSVVRAMDAIEEVSVATGVTPIRRHVLAGHSKRGHAAWLAAAVDSRVAGIIPIAIDVLNSREQIAHHRLVAGEISGSSQIFAEVIDGMDTPRGRCLMTMIDPFTYRSALAEPKLVVLGTNDDYTPVDALNLYWDELPGSGSVLYLPNTSHAGADSHPYVNAAAFAFVRAVAAGESLPEIEWSTMAVGGGLTVRAIPGAAARSARVWAARAPGRDFRTSTWEEMEMEQAAAGSTTEGLVAGVQLPAAGYLAVFVEVEFEADVPYRLSTQVRVIDAHTGAIVATP